MQKMHESSFTPIDSFDLRRWRAFVGDATRYPIDAHPDVIGWALPEGAGAMVYTDSDQGRLQTMALLAPARLPAVREMPWLTHFDGWRLVGNRLAGRDDDEAYRHFITASMDLLAHSDADCMFFEDIEVDAPLWRAAVAADTGSVSIDYPKPAQPHWLLRFPDTPADYWQRLPRKSRYNLRREAKRFPHRVDAITTAAQVPAFLEAAHTVSEHSWQGKRTVTNIANSERQRAMFTAMANLGALRSYLLYHDDQPVAFVYGWQWQGLYNYEQIGYDGRVAAHGPGKVLLFRLIEDLIARDTPEVLDFGNGDADYKRRFATEHTATGPITLNARKLKTHVALTLRHWRNSADRGMRLALRRTGLYDRVRRAYHHV